ncbi:MAG: hypothetical protein MJ105_04325 [Lachnospiraceae bacterium]|nr:hypothetical protein [Lachnospiraceae bacterium]
MTIQEAKEFYFKCMCIDYNMFNSNVEKYHDVLRCSTIEMRDEWKIEYIGNRAELVYTDVENASHHFRNACLLLCKRDPRMRDLAKRIVEIFEECPFQDDLSKLIVKEGICDEKSKPWYSGFSTICFYGEYAERLKNAIDDKYSKLFSDEQKFNDFCEKSPLIGNGIVSKDSLLRRAKESSVVADFLYEYMKSDKFMEDKAKFESGQRI